MVERRPWRVTMSTVALQSDIETRWISANGTLVNLVCAVILWLLLRNGHRYGPADSILSDLGFRRELIHRHRLFFLFWRFELRRLGSRHPRSAPALDVACGTRCWLGVASYYASDAAGGCRVEALSRECGESTKASRAMLDALFHRRNPGRSRRSAESRRTLLCDRLGAAFDSGRECWPAQPAKHDAAESRPANPKPEPSYSAQCRYGLRPGAIASLLFIFVLGRGITWAR